MCVIRILKQLLYILLLILAVKTADARPYDELKSAFSTGNVSLLSDHFDDKVNLLFNNQSNNLSTFQAKLLLENFFAANKPNRFTVEETGESSYDGINYLIGKLETSSGNYRVYIMIRLSKTNGYFIKEIRFE